MKETTLVALSALALVTGCEANQEGGPYALPSADNQHYAIIYLHGRIIEDQGLPAISERYGEYRFDDIIARFREEGFTVVADVRTADADVGIHADRTLNHVDDLLAEGIPPGNITVVGASKGAYIAALASHRSEDSELRFVLLAGCSAEVTSYMLEEDIRLYGHVLTIRDALDTELAGSCEEVLADSPGVSASNEIVVSTGREHGLIYSPLAEWVKPTISWARRNGTGQDADE